jgi:putative spermidine/putrescine transport system permease protein
MIDSIALLYMLTTLVVLVTALWFVNPTQLVSRVRKEPVK